MSSLVEHAERELKLACPYQEEDAIGKDDFNEVLTKNVLELVQTFANQRHSGSTSEIVIGLLGELLHFKPLTPLTGDQEEWLEVPSFNPEYRLFQNIRSSRVFTEVYHTGRVVSFDVNGRGFLDSDGTLYWDSQRSRVEIAFPYMPSTEIVDKMMAVVRDLSEAEVKEMNQFNQQGEPAIVLPSVHGECPSPAGWAVRKTVDVEAAMVNAVIGGLTEPEN